MKDMKIGQTKVIGKVKDKFQGPGMKETGADFEDGVSKMCDQGSHSLCKSNECQCACHKKKKKK